MKQAIIFLLILLLGIFFFGKYLETTGYVTMTEGEEVQIEAKTVTIKKISPGKIVIDVDSVKGIINKGSEKTINNVIIKVSDVFYVEEKEDRIVKLSLSPKFICGDGVCDSPAESQQDCCTDCLCDAPYSCIDNKCQIDLDECKKNKDCDDNKESTMDLCTGTPKKCVHRIATECSINDDCDDQNECTLDECRNNECFNTEIPGCGGEEETEEQEEKTVEKTLSTIKEEKAGFFSNLIGKILNLFK